MSKLSKSSVKSAWTPLNNEALNEKSLSGITGTKSHINGTTTADPFRAIFNERRLLVNKWFDKWGDAQRLLVLEDLIAKCRVKNLEQAGVALARRKPMMHEDFTRAFPRVLSQYVFSYLDPRSLCRCAQVSWHWKSIVESDQLWMKKCLRLGWTLSFSPSPYETGMWKRLYIENIVALKSTLPPQQNRLNLKELENMALADRHSAMGSSRSRASSQFGKRPPWKGSDPTPKDTWRNNYLENEDEVEKVNRLRKRGVYGAEADDILRKAKVKVNSGAAQSLLHRSNSLTRLKSSPMLSETAHTPTSERPVWARPPSGASFRNDADFAGVPVGASGDIDPRAAFAQTKLERSTKKPAQTKMITTQRSARDPPSVDLFPSQPWLRPTTADNDEEYDNTAIY